ncbi:hypothetical protein [Nocardia farcinica]|uniref:hypothetical protein n=2 Tax=Nocardia farcinica TaxID=37329 RepID=UPI001E345D24|nr:hypothetical protein [Nocardia farcinica]
MLERYGTPRNVYDPFGGSGTTQLAASQLGIPSWYSEINPFMVFVADTKIQSVISARKDLDGTEALVNEYTERLHSELDEWAAKADLSSYEQAFPGRNFFEEKHLRDLLGALSLGDQVGEKNPTVRSLFRLACAANAVGCSNMTRRADLRRRRDDEYKNRVVDVKSAVTSTVSSMLEDIRTQGSDNAPATFASGDCRSIGPEYHDAFELAVTSPPYLNGTNYFRNTKIELWLLGYIETEADLGQFRSRSVAAGINNVSRRSSYRLFDPVESVAERLDRAATDKRIPMLVRHYFSDMSEVLASVHRVLLPGGRFVLDIGDSKFYGVHVPTDNLLIDVAQTVGLSLESDSVLAKRYSRDKSELVQRELVFRKEIA